MSIRDVHNRKVLSDARKELGNNIGKVATRDCGTSRQFKPQNYQNRVRGHNINYNQRHYQNRYSSNNRSNNADRGQYRQDKGRPRNKPNYWRGTFRGNMRSYGRQDSTGEYRNNYRNESYDRSRNRSRGRLFFINYGNHRNRSTSNSRSRSGSIAITNRDRIQSYKCRECNRFTKDCPTSREEKEIEQL